jgi:IS30 family transposase
MSHHHFTLNDRSFIQFGIESNKSRRQIAEELGVSHTAINYEVANNSVILEVVITARVNKPKILSLDMRHRRGRGEVSEKIAARARWKQRLDRYAKGQPIYDAELAHVCYLERRGEVNRRSCKLQDGNILSERIAARLLSLEKGSPEQIANDLRKEGVVICCQTIYDWIRRSTRSKKLQMRLRRRGKRYRYATETNLKWNKTKDKRNIRIRPSIVERVVRYGDLEGDTIFGLDTKDRILSHLDRVTGIMSLSLVLGYDSYKIHKQTLIDINRVFGNGIYTITYDNGVEFSAWKNTEQKLGLEIFFADPYRSSQRGRNENGNGLVRDYFPKGTDFKKITNKELRKVESILNSRSRKRYNWRNPLEQRELVLSNG